MLRRTGFAVALLLLLSVPATRAQAVAPDLEPETSSATVNPGEAHTYTLRVANTGATNETFDVSLLDQPAGWTVDLRPTAVTVVGHGTKSVLLTVTPSSTIPDGGVAHVGVRAANRASAASFDDVATDTTLVAPFVPQSSVPASPGPASFDFGTPVLLPGSTTRAGGPSLVPGLGGRRVAAAAAAITLAAVAAAVLSTESVRWRLRLAGLALFSRLDRDRVLDHELRERVFEAIRRTPGVHYGGLKRMLAVPPGTLAHHLYVLEREELVRSSPDGFRRRFYPRGQRDWGPTPLTTVEVALVQAVSSQPGMSQRAVAQRLGLSKQLANYHLLKLERMGRIILERTGREALCYPGRGNVAPSSGQAPLSNHGTP